MDVFGRSGPLHIALLVGAVGCGSAVAPVAPPSQKAGAGSPPPTAVASSAVVGDPSELPTLRLPVGGRVQDVAFSDDGERIAITATGIAPQIHRVESGDVEMLVRHSDGFPDGFLWCGGTRVVVGTRFRDAETFDLLEPDKVVTLEGIAGPVVCSTSGRLLDPDDRDGHLWDAASGTRHAKLGRLTEHQTVTWLSADGSHFAYVEHASAHTTLTLAVLASGDTVFKIQEPRNTRFVVSRSAIIATNGNNLTVFGLDGRRLGTVKPVEDLMPRRTFAWSSRDRGVWVAGPDSVALWDVEKGEAKHTIAVADARSLALTPDGSRLAIVFERWVELVDVSTMEGRPEALGLRARESDEAHRRRFWRDVCRAPTLDPYQGEDLCREILFGSGWAEGYIETAGDAVPPALRHAYGYYDRKALEPVVAAAGIDECAWLEHLRRNGTVPKPLPPEQEAGLARVLDAIESSPADKRTVLVQLGCAQLQGCADSCAPAFCSVDITAFRFDAALAVCPDLAPVFDGEEVDAKKLREVVERRFTAYLDAVAPNLDAPAQAALAKRRATLGL